MYSIYVYQFIIDICMTIKTVMFLTGPDSVRKTDRISKLCFATCWSCQNFFQEQHGWTSATWAGICQTSGDLLAAVMMGFVSGGSRPDMDEPRGSTGVFLSFFAIRSIQVFLPSQIVDLQTHRKTR